MDSYTLYELGEATWQGMRLKPICTADGSEKDDGLNLLRLIFEAIREGKSIQVVQQLDADKTILFSFSVLNEGKLAEYWKDFIKKHITGEIKFM